MNTKQYDIIVLGFGKAGKTLAAKFGSMGKSVAMIEENPLMYGGTCINIACIPTKTMIIAASKGLSYDQVLNQREVVTSRLRNKNFTMLDSNEFTMSILDMVNSLAIKKSPLPLARIRLYYLLTLSL